MNTHKYSKDELIAIYKDFLKYPSKYKGSDMNNVTRTLSHKYNINPHKLKTECGDAVEHYKQPLKEKRYKEMDSQYLQRNLKITAKDIRKMEPNLSKLLFKLASRLNQSYPDGDVGIEDIKKLLNEPSMRSLARSVKHLDISLDDYVADIMDENIEEKSNGGQNLIGKKFKSVSKVRAEAPGRGVDFIQVAGTVKDVKGNKVTIEDPLGHIYIINKNDFSRKNKFKNEIREVKWVKTKESIPVGTKVKITYGRHKNKMGIVSDDAATDGYSIVKVSGKKITIDDSDLLIKENTTIKKETKSILLEKKKVQYPIAVIPNWNAEFLTVVLSPNLAIMSPKLAWDSNTYSKEYLKQSNQVVKDQKTIESMLNRPSAQSNDPKIINGFHKKIEQNFKKVGKTLPSSIGKQIKSTPNNTTDKPLSQNNKYRSWAKSQGLDPDHSDSLNQYKGTEDHRLSKPNSNTANLANKPSRNKGDKVYLNTGEKPPKGKKIEKGPRGGAFYTEGNTMKKTDLKELIKEEFKAYLNESNDGYVELIIMDPDFEKGWNLILKAWYRWKMGPATESNMIRPAKQDLVKYLSQLANKEIKL